MRKKSSVMSDSVRSPRQEILGTQKLQVSTYSKHSLSKAKKTDVDQKYKLINEMSQKGILPVSDRVDLIGGSGVP